MSEVVVAMLLPFIRIVVGFWGFCCWALTSDVAGLKLLLVVDVAGDGKMVIPLPK